MNRGPLLTTLATSVALALSLNVSSVIAAPEFAEGRILVKRAPGLASQALDRILKKSGLKTARKLRGTAVDIIETPRGAEKALARVLHKNPHIAFAEVDYRYQMAATNDPGFSKQWHLPVMQAPAAWDTSDGEGIIVAVLDTGVSSSHPDLQGKVLTGYNTLSNDSNTSDFHNHGTMVSGVIAAHANNAVGGASVAPGTKILPIRITNDGYAYASDMAEGITWAANNGARVANLSFSGAAGSYVVANAASEMMNKGGVVVVSAANDGTDLGYSNSPYLFVAGSTNSKDERSSFSNYGQYVDIAAPGEMIYTTNRNGGYSYVQGTSFSSPNTAAVAALVMAANPSLTPTEVLAVIANTADDLGSTGWDPYFGFGRVNALAAVEMAANAGASDTTPPDVAVASPGSGNTVNGDVSVTVRADDDFGVTSVSLFINGTEILSETHATESGYVFSWDSTSVADGQHTISARAVDAAGNIGASSDVVVTVANIGDQTPPIATISSPRNGQTIGRLASLSGYGRDDQRMAQFSLSVNGKVKCSGTSSTACIWNTRKLAAGSYTISARAVDHAGNVGEKSISVTVRGSR